MDTYRYCVLGPGGRVEVASEFECELLEDATRVARNALQTDPRFSGVELWQGGRRVFMEFSETPQRAIRRGRRDRDSDRDWRVRKPISEMCLAQKQEHQT